MLLCGETIEEMSKLPDKSVNMILADLPYGTTKNKWDSIIPIQLLWEQYKRIIVDNGVIVIFGQDKFTAMMMLSEPNLHRYNLVWEKDRPSGFLNSRRMPLRSHEDIMVFYKKLPTYNPQFWEGEALHGMGEKVFIEESNNNNYGKFSRVGKRELDRTGSTQKFPRSILKFPRPHPPIHPTQKPVELYEWLIKTYTDEGNIVLDNVSGSGTTAIASENTNRRWICIEKEVEYCDTTVKRLNEIRI